MGSVLSDTSHRKARKKAEKKNCDPLRNPDGTHSAESKKCYKIVRRITHRASGGGVGRALGRLSSKLRKAMLPPILEKNIPKGFAPHEVLLKAMSPGLGSVVLQRHLERGGKGVDEGKLNKKLKRKFRTAQKDNTAQQWAAVRARGYFTPGDMHLLQARMMTEGAVQERVSADLTAVGGRLNPAAFTSVAPGELPSAGMADARPARCGFFRRLMKACA